jgi:hypothetical protein
LRWSSQAAALALRWSSQAAALRYARVLRKLRGGGDRSAAWTAPAMSCCGKGSPGRGGVANFGSRQ